jgi:mRNA interferase MazF
MKSGINYSCEQGSVVLVPFPFTDLSGKKKRPVLVISNNKYNRANRDFICCGITSNVEDADYSVPIDTQDFQFGFLAQPSKIKVDRITILEQSLIIKTIGRVNIEIIEKVKDELFKLF